jgi:tetrapyrrole methylase family protein/MazG family protein
LEKNITHPPPSPFKALADLIRSLRGENGCPWDKQQTPATIGRYLVEEVHELVEAIETGDAEAVCEELGDVLFHVFFLSRLFEEAGRFNIKDVAKNNTVKMIRRHPHVFGDSQAKTTDDIRAQWHRIKQQEKQDDPPKSVLDSIPAGLPALMRAYRISERAAATGFDWDNIGEVFQKVEEEWGEFQEALNDQKRDPEKAEKNQPDDVMLEFGDLIFTLTNVARFARFHPETATAAATRKFEHRFKWMEQAAADKGCAVEDLERTEMERLWKKAKDAERKRR